LNSRAVVLLVDDDALILGCVTTYLEDEGFTVHSAMSAEDALMVIGRLRPAVCITDLWLPGMNGEEFILQARQLSPASRFIVHTGSEYILPKTLLDIGMTPLDVLVKPMRELSLLSSRIKKLSLVGRS